MSDCNHNLEYAYTIDKSIPGDIESTAIFKCTKCGEKFLEGEIEHDERRTNRIFPNKSN